MEATLSILFIGAVFVGMIASLLAITILFLYALTWVDYLDEKRIKSLSKE